MASQVRDVGQRVRQVEGSIEERTIRVQAPIREQVAKMETIWKQKVTEELSLRRQEQKLDRALSAFKSHAKVRKLEILGYDDAGRKWKALPEGIRKAVEDFNRLTKEERTLALARMREDLRLKPEQVEKLVLKLGRGRGEQGGISI